MSPTDALAATALLPALQAFDPHVVGTPLLGLDVPGSDIDVVCHATDLDAVAETLWHRYRDRDGFTLRRWIHRGRPLLACFSAYGWTFEVFASMAPVAEQPGWRHFQIERRLLDRGGPALRAAIMVERHRGLKPEAAFACVLGLPGDPYAALLTLEGCSDKELSDLLVRCLTSR